MKAKKIYINISGSGDYRIEDNEIVKSDGSSFIAKMKGDTLTLSSGSSISVGGRGSSISIGGSNISVGGSININGLSISTHGKTLIVDGNINSVIVNGEEFISSGKSSTKKETKREDEYTSYSLKHFSISAINISGSGKLSMDNEIADTNTEASLSLSVSGSGDILLYNYRALSIMASIAGSGDIVLNNVHGPAIMANVAGSGDISGRNSSFNSVSKNVVGSGDISGF